MRQKENRKKRGNYEGSFNFIRGRWRGRIMINRKNYSVFGKTRKEAQNKLFKVLQEAGIIKDENTLLKDWLIQWLEIYQSGKRNTTKETYRYLIEKHVIPNIGHLSIVNLKPSHVSKLFHKLLKTLSSSTVSMIRNILSSAIKQAVKTELVIRNIIDVVDAPKVEQVNHTILTEDQLHLLLECVKNSRFKYVYLFMICGGLRRGEALAIKWSWIDFSTNTVFVKETLVKTSKGIETNQPKSKSSKRAITLPDFVINELLKTPKRKRIGYVTKNSVGRALSPCVLWLDYSKMLKVLNFPRITLHDLRHTHASHLLNKKIPLSDVARRLGHSRISTTSEIYAHVVPETHDDAAKVFDDIARGLNNG